MKKMYFYENGQIAKGTKLKKTETDQYMYVDLIYTEANTAV